MLKRRDELIGVGEALRGILRERAQHHRVELRWNRGSSALGGRGGAAETCLSAIVTAVSPSKGTVPVSSS